MTTTANPRRELGTAVLLCVVGAAAVLLTGQATWGRVELVVGESLPVVVVELSGRQAAPVAIALGLLGLAAGAALLATRGAVRRTVGVVLLVAGIAVVVDAVRAAGRLGQLAVDTSPGASAGVTTATGWSWVAVAGGIMLAGAGLLTTVRGGRWSAMSQRYEAPGADRSSATGGPSATSQDPDAAWRALDRGEDPTV